MDTHEVPVTWAGRHHAIHDEAVEPCFGLGCLRRGVCQCYHAVESAPGGSTARASCLRCGQYPAYAAVEPPGIEGPAAVRRR